MTQRIFVMSPFCERMESCADEQEAANLILHLIEDEEVDKDDIYVVRGEEIQLAVKKQKVASVSFDGTKIL